MSAPSDYAKQLFTGDVITKAILRTIADFADWTTGRCYPKVETIAKWAECSEDTVRRRIKDLEKIGLLKVEKRKGSTNIYTLTGFKQWFKEEKERRKNKKKRGSKYDEGGSSLQGVQDDGDSLTAEKDLAHSDPRPCSQLPKHTYLTNNNNISFAENKKEMEKELSGLSNEEVKVEIRENKIFLCKPLKEKWLQLFNSEQDLELALVQILPYLQNRNPVQLEVQVSSQLSRICRERRERDARYANSSKKEKKPFTPSRWGINYD